MVINKYLTQHIPTLKGISDREKCIVALCNLQRHEICVARFDQFYNENLSSDFRASLNVLVEFLCGADIDLQAVQKTALRGPDSDDYPHIEGSLAQNAFGALYYLCKYMSSKNDKNFLQSLDKSFESIDALKYDEGTQEEQDNYFSEEGRVLESLINNTIRGPSATIENIKHLMLLAQLKSIGR